MPGDLFTLPIRLGLRVARLTVRGGVQVSERAVGLAAFAVQAVRPGRDAQAPEPEEPSDHVRAGTEDAEARAEDGGPEARPDADPRSIAEPVQDSPEVAAQEAIARVPDPPAASASATAAVEEPAHVSEEPVLVESFAEPGVEDGAGAQVTVDEPWEGYAQLNAEDVIARIGEASAAELAAVDLFERVNRNRSTVIAAVERGMYSDSGNRPAAADPTN
ncbi:MAG: hypothetical protein M3Z27_00925 [Actinomycetota bacterium]|nr:hypothetical protein [Actinomycetota bacterium]